MTVFTFFNFDFRVRKSNLFLTFVLAILLGTGSICSAKNATDLMSQALKLRSNGQITDAIQILEQAIEVSRSSYQRNLAQFMLGDCLLEAGHAKKAQAVYEKLLTEDLTDDERAEALYRLAQTHERLGQIDKARTLCQQIEKLYKSSSFAKLAKLLEKSLEQRSDSRSVYNSAEEAYRLSSSVTSSRRTIATSSLPSLPQSASTPQSVTLSESKFSVKQTPTSPKEITTISSSSSAEKKSLYTKNVVNDSNSSSTSAASRPSSTTVQAGVDFPAELLNFPKPSQSERESLATEILKYQEVLQRSPDDPDNDAILFKMADATTKFGEYLEACKTYDRLLAQFPSSQYAEAAYYEAIRLRAFLKVYKAVISWGEAFIKTFPRSNRIPAVKRLIAFAKNRLEANNKTQTTFQTQSSLASGKLSDDPRYKEAKRQMAAEHYSMALRQFEALSKVYSNDPQIWWELALVQVQQERYSDAENSLNRLLALDPNNQDARSLLGYCHYQRKDFAKAADTYSQTDDSAQTAAEGLNFFDSQSASKRLQASRSNSTRNQSAAPAAKKAQGEEQ